MQSNDFTVKGTSWRESTSFELFYLKISWGWGSSLQRWGGVRNSREASMGMKCCHTSLLQRC